MPSPSEKLADALDRMRAVQVDGIVRSDQLTRTYLKRLTGAGFLREIIRGWSYVTNPAARDGSTVWYSRYWSFLHQYLTERFGDDYCLLPEPSLRLLTGSTIIPRQLAIMRRSPGQQVLTLSGDSSLLIYQDAANFPENVVEVNGVRAMGLAEAVVRAPEAFFRDSPEDAEIALHMLRDPTTLLSDLLEHGRSVVAGRIAGAFRHIGDTDAADRIIQTMRSAGFDVRERDPFERAACRPTMFVRSPSPYVARLTSMWAAMREDVAIALPPPPGRPKQTKDYLARVEEVYVNDAYNSLSIEGYQVTPDLIERVRTGEWDPVRNVHDRESADAMAARGYLEAFRAVKADVREILGGADAAATVRRAHHAWHRALFAPAVQSGLIPASALAGYRRGPVFITGSRHVPLPDHAVPDAMERLFDLIGEEDEPSVRAVLGHLLFVFIHPYADGNGRLGRFLMNALLADGGYPWTIIRVENRAQYMSALEAASVDRNVRPFVEFIATEMTGP